METSEQSKGGIRAQKGRVEKNESAVFQKDVSQFQTRQVINSTVVSLKRKDIIAIHV